MIFIRTVKFEDGLALLEKESQSKPSINEPKELPLEEIKTAHAVFQPRQLEQGYESGCNEDHIRNLVEAILNEPLGVLDPIDIWWSGNCWRVINGHHRLLAYARVRKMGKLKTPLIPVKIFKGNLSEAIAESIRLNSKDTLMMSKSDKLNRAWILTCLEKHSKNEISRICKVGTSTISRMREKLREIREHFKNSDYWMTIAMGMPWEEAQAFGRALIERGNNDWQEKIALDWSRRLGKTFGTKLATQPEITARALELYSEKLTKDLANWWSEIAQEEDEEI
jgi:ParB-like nuclease domain